MWEWDRAAADGRRIIVSLLVSSTPPLRKKKKNLIDAFVDPYFLPFFSFSISPPIRLLCCFLQELQGLARYDVESCCSFRDFYCLFFSSILFQACFGAISLQRIVLVEDLGFFSDFCFFLTLDLVSAERIANSVLSLGIESWNSQISRWAKCLKATSANTARCRQLSYRSWHLLLFSVGAQIYSRVISSCFFADIICLLFVEQKKQNISEIKISLDDAESLVRYVWSFYWISRLVLSSVEMLWTPWFADSQDGPWGKKSAA